MVMRADPWPRGWWNLPGVFASSSLTTRNEPDMPRCISSTSPEARSAIRYLARRPRPVTVWPVQPRDKILLERKPQVFAPGFHFHDPGALHDGLQAAADGLDFG